MKDRLWSRLSRAAWLAFAVHLLAGLALALILRRGLETNADLGDRLRFVGGSRLAWTAGWICWTVAALTILNFYARFAAAHLSALLLVWASRSSYPRWIQIAGFGVVAGGAAPSAAAWADSAAGMLWANVVLVPGLLLWMAGVAARAARRKG